MPDQNSLIEKMFEHSPVHPYDPSVGLYNFNYPRFPQVLTFSGWQDETMSWKETCALFVGL